jgi:fibronectin-binding autotransporter adhesin
VALSAVMSLSVAVSISPQPLPAHALPTYSVVSQGDFPKQSGSATDCRSTQTPNNPCTLRAAIETVNATGSGATIAIPENFLITLDPGLGELAVNAAMSIASVGAGATVDGGLQIRVFHIGSGAAGVSMSNLTVRRGKATGVTHRVGGGIWNEGTLTLDNVIVTQNEGKNAGGVDDEGRLTVNGGMISGNAAIRDPMSTDDAVAGGLAVTSAAVANLNGTVITNNSADLGGGVGVLGTATLSNIVLKNNTANLLGAGIVVASQGSQSALANLVLHNSTVSDNVSAASGGGIAVGMARLSLSGTTVNGNRANAGSGGGISVGSSSATVTNSTLTGNVAAQGGGGISQGIFVPPAGTRPGAAASPVARPAAVPDDVTLSWVTLAGNSAQTGGGILNAAGLTFTVSNSIVAQNSATAGAGCSGPVISGGHNLDSGSGCGFSAGGDRSDSNPQLNPLTDNGGPTSTMSLQASSPAIDAGDPSCPPPPTDQRGAERPQGPACDIGAFEAPSLPAPPVTGARRRR